jgi:hypothetical protein
VVLSVAACGSARGLVRAARRAFAKARHAAGEIPDSRSWDRVWRETDPAGRQRLLRGALGAVVVRRGRGSDPERVRVLARGIEIEADQSVDFDRLPSEAIVT